MVCFSETRYKSRDMFIERRYRLVCSNDESTISSSSGVITLNHNRWIVAIKRTICIQDRVMILDLKIFQKTIEFCTESFMDIANETIPYDGLICGLSKIRGGTWEDLIIFDIPNLFDHSMYQPTMSYVLDPIIEMFWHLFNISIQWTLGIFAIHEESDD